MDISHIRIGYLFLNNLNIFLCSMEYIHYYLKYILFSKCYIKLDIHPIFNFGHNIQKDALNLNLQLKLYKML